MSPTDKTEHDYLKSEFAHQKVTLKEYILHLMQEQDRRMQERDARYQQRFESTDAKIIAAQMASKEAVGAADSARQDSVRTIELAKDKATTAIDEKLKLHNESYAHLLTQQSTFANRNEVEKEFSAVRDKINDVATQQSRGAGRDSGIGTVGSVVVVVLSLVIAAAGVVIAAVVGRGG